MIKIMIFVFDYCSYTGIFFSSRFIVILSLVVKTSKIRTKSRKTPKTRTKSRKTPKTGTKSCTFIRLLYSTNTFFLVISWDFVSGGHFATKAVFEGLISGSYFQEGFCRYFSSENSLLLFIAPNKAVTPLGQIFENFFYREVSSVFFPTTIFIVLRII